MKQFSLFFMVSLFPIFSTIGMEPRAPKTAQTNPIFARQMLAAYIYQQTAQYQHLACNATTTTTQTQNNFQKITPIVPLQRPAEIDSSIEKFIIILDKHMDPIIPPAAKKIKKSYKCRYCPNRRFDKPSVRKTHETCCIYSLTQKK